MHLYNNICCSEFLKNILTVLHYCEIVVKSDIFPLSIPTADILVNRKHISKYEMGMRKINICI